MTLLQNLQSLFKSTPAEWKQSKGIHEITVTVAERKAFLSTQKLQYLARFRIDEDQKVLHFTEMLKESGAGLSTGGDADNTPGFGFKTETYKTGGAKREGTLEEQSSLLGKKYEYRFNFSVIREKVEEIARSEGYQFEFHLTAKSF